MQLNKIIYWLSTIIFCGIFLFSASMYFTKYEMVKGFFTSLGYPVYIIYPLAIAKVLSSHAAIESLRYPYLPSHPHHSIAIKQMKNGGGIVCFNLKGGLESGKIFLNSLQMLSLTANLGDTRSIASHPASTTHAKLSEEERLATNITPGLIRISVGLEHVDDILQDILQALEKCVEA